MGKLRTANLLGALAGAVSQVLDARVGSHHNGTDTSAAALNLLALYEGCSNAALSQALELSHPATVRLVDRLEAAGLVESRPGIDRRSVALFLTTAGRNRARTILQQRCLALGGLVEVLSPAQQRQLDDIAETLLRALTSSPVRAAHICRLCDEIACPPDQCPVHQSAQSMLSSVEPEV